MAKEHIEYHTQVAELEGNVNRLASDLFAVIHEGANLQRANKIQAEKIAMLEQQCKHYENRIDDYGYQREKIFADDSSAVEKLNKISKLAI